MMDPNANLDEQLKLSRQIQKDEDEDTDICPADASRLAELVLAQHEWLTKGGFLPAAWKRRDGGVSSLLGK